jgi:PAS domain S-box-containing protein
MRPPQHKPAHGAPAPRRRSRGVAQTAADSVASREARSGLPDGTSFRKHADALFGDAPDGVTLQLGGRIVYANRRMAELLGHPHPDALLGLSSLQFYGDDDLAPVLARLQATFFGRRAAPARHELKRSDGTTIPVEAACLLLSISRSRVLIEIVRSLEPARLN